MVTRESLLDEIGRFISANEMKETTFGKRAVNDGKLVGRLRAGGSVSLKTADTILKFMRDFVPANAGRAA